MGELKEQIKGNTNERIGDAKAVIGDATDNEKLVEEGKLQHAKGDLQERKGEVEGALGDDI